MSGKTIPSFVGSELNLLKLGSVLVGLSGGVLIFSMKANNVRTAVFEDKCVFLPVDWNWSSPRTNPYINESLV